MSRSRTVLYCLSISAAMFCTASSFAQFRRAVVTPPIVRPVVGPTFFPVVSNAFSAGSYLQGAASVIDAQGQFMVARQESNLLREQVRAAELENRRRVFEQDMYERANTPTLEELRELRRQQEFWRSWNDPPLTEIWSGTALNNLLTAVQRARSDQGFQGPKVPLNAEIIQRINVTSGATPASLGPFRNADDLRWPQPLLQEKFGKERAEIDKLAPQVVKQLAAGEADGAAIDKLNDAIARLRSLLRENVREMSSTDYIQSLRHVNQLAESARAMRNPAAVKLPTLAATSVGELVDQMTQKGLRFARATIGEEASYTALHRDLATYSAGLPEVSLRDLRAQFHAPVSSE